MRLFTSILTAFGLVAMLGAMTTARAADLWQTIQTEPSIKIFTMLAEGAGLDAELSGDGLYTVFAPSDAAFAAMAPGKRDAILSAPASDTAKAFIARHIMSGRLEARKTMGRVVSAELSSGEALPFAARFAGCGAIHASLGGAGLLHTDIHATNGVLHVLEEPLL